MGGTATKKRSKRRSARYVPSNGVPQPRKLTKEEEQKVMEQVRAELDAELDRKFRPVVGMGYKQLHQQVEDGTLSDVLAKKLVKRFACWEVRKAVKRGELSLIDAARFACWNPAHCGEEVFAMQCGGDVAKIVTESLEWEHFQERNEKARLEFEAKNGCVN